MATRTVNTVTNIVKGKVVHSESNLPLPNLLVSVYDLDPDSRNVDTDQIFVNTDPKSVLSDPKTFKIGRNGLPNGIPGDRLGSTLTDENGHFQMDYEDDAFKIRRRKAANGQPEVDLRPDLFITVQSAEESSHKEFENIIYRSNWARINAGRSEYYLIKIGSKQLKAANVEIPKIEDSDKLQKDDQSRIKNQLESFKDVHSLIEKEVIKEVSTLDKSNEYHLKNIDNLEGSQEKIIKNGLASLISKKQGAYVFLSEDDKLKLDSYTVSDGDEEKYKNVPAELFDALLNPSQKEDSSPLDLFKSSPIANYCNPVTEEEKCSMDYLGLEDAEDSTDDASEEVVEDDVSMERNELIPTYIANLITSQTAPEEGVAFNNTTSLLRPSQNDIQNTINTFSLKSSPADVPAYYDFNQLLFAFDSLWYELIDEEIIDLTKKAYHQLNAIAGEDVANGFVTSQAPIFQYFRDKSKGVRVIDSNSIPVEIVRHFNITLLQYQSLTREYKESLIRIANTLDTFLSPRKVEYYREQGIRIINSVSGDEYTNLHKILQELHDRLLKKYNFTIYAANKKKRSINFGAILTYRQKWDPINYQVGELVKTIPLAPKEERKFNKKITIKQKRNEKEVENNSSTFRDEISTTSRLESDAVKKAMTKTDFSMVSEGGFSFFGLGEGSQQYIEYYR